MKSNSRLSKKSIKQKDYLRGKLDFIKENKNKKEEEDDLIVMINYVSFY